MPKPSRQLRPLALADVKIADTFWAPRQETNRTAGIRHQYKQLKETGRLDSLKLGWKPGQDNPPHHFWDSDIAKWIEAAGYSLATHPDPELQKLVDDTAALVASAQQADGYLNVHFTVVEPEKRWSNLRDAHELYCAGHLMEGAVAHFQATGNRVLLDALCRYADHIGRTFGPERGKKKGYPGHEEIELALIKLYHATGNERYLKLSKYFIDQRGQQPHYYDEEAVARGDDPKKYWARNYEYLQAHKPVREQDEAVGHSVRAMYLYSGMADVAAETGDEALLAACKKLWASTAERKMFLTGGVGSSHWGEKFTGDYELPNEAAYAETCAAIGLVFFAHRMLQIEADAKYADAMEQALYNGVISGVDLAGTKFFYVNPLASNGGHHRQEWFGCACCPPNIARLVASLGSYIYSAAPDGLYVHLYVAGEGAAEVGGQRVTLRQETAYPWNGDVKLTVGIQQPSKFDLFLRIPGWCRKHTLRVDGKAVGHRIVKGYARISRTWANGDRVELSLAMPIERVAAHPRVAQDAGKVALRRGPLVYCLEQCDNAAPVRSILLPDKAKLTARFDRVGAALCGCPGRPRRAAPTGGVVVIEGQGLAPTQGGWKGKLYRPAAALSLRPARFRAIPYCLWDNREAGAMTVWLPRA